MNENFLKELQNSAEDAEIMEIMNYEDNFNINEFLNVIFKKYSEMNNSNSTKRGKNPKVIKARRKKNKNKKTHRK